MATDEVVDPFQERIINAAQACFQEVGIQRTSMEDISRSAGVGRMTVFRRFETKDQLVQTVILRVVSKATLQVRAAYLAEKHLEQGLTAALMTSLQILRDDPLFAKVARTEPESFLRSLTTGGATIIAVVRSSVGDWLGSSGGGPLTDEDAQFVAETVTRLGISLILTPTGPIPFHDDDLMRAYLARYVVPGIAYLATP